MAFEKDPNEIGALWMKTSSKGTEYLSGEISGVKVVCFRATKKSERGPDYRVMKSTERGDRAPRRDESEEPPF